MLYRDTEKMKTGRLHGHGNGRAAQERMYGGRANPKGNCLQMKRLDF